MPSVLITDGENRSALAATRSLGKKGCRVVVSSKDRLGIATHSKYCDKRYLTPDPGHEGEAYLDRVMNVVENEPIDVIFPMTEVSIHHFNTIRSQLPDRVILACPNHEKMAAVSDKFRLFQLAERLDVPIPRTIYLSHHPRVNDHLDRIEHFPVVIKPGLSKIPTDKDVFLSGGVRYASTPEMLQHIYSTSPVLQYPSMIQEKIVGPGTGLFTLFDGKKHLALFSHRRLREKPPSGGVSVVSESVPLDREMVESAAKLLSAVEFKGVAMVEFKRDLRDGKAKLMEINGRFWGTLQLAIACGVDFPSLYLDYLCGNPLPDSVPDYRIGHKMKWFFGTLDHLWIRLKTPDAKLNLAAGYPTRLRSMIDFLTIWDKQTSFDVFDPSDCQPFLMEFCTLLKDMLKPNQ